MLIKTRKLTSWKCLWIVSPKNRLFQKNVSKNSLHWSWRSSNPFIALLCRKWLGKSFEEKIFGRGWEEFPYKSKFHIFLESLFQREGIVLIKMPKKLKRERAERSAFSVANSWLEVSACYRLAVTHLGSPSLNLNFLTSRHPTLFTPDQKFIRVGNTDYFTSKEDAYFEF